jgi:hypothetical protein
MDVFCGPQLVENRSRRKETTRASEIDRMLLGIIHRRFDDLSWTALGVYGLIANWRCYMNL